MQQRNIANMEDQIKTLGKFNYLDVGAGEPIILLHGLFGALSNFQGVINHFKPKFRVLVPILPLFDLGLETGVSGLAKFVNRFIDKLKLDHVHLMGNSLGGHVSLLYTLKHQPKVKTLTLAGSSGLFENGMGETYPKRGDYEYMRKKAELTFYDPKIATKELVDEIYEIVNNRAKVIKIIALAKSAIRNNLSHELREIEIPTCLIWGQNDTITPPMVAHEFKRLIPNSELHWIDKCGHAPMMERPEEFCKLWEVFLVKHSNATS